MRRRNADGRPSRVVVFVDPIGAIHTAPAGDPRAVAKLPLDAVIGIYDHSIDTTELWSDIEWFMYRHRDPAEVQGGVFVGRLLQ